MVTLPDEAKAAATQLGWPADEAGIRAGLPSTLSLKVVGKLLSERGALHQAVRGTQEAERQKGLDLQDYQADLGALPSAEASPALRQALAEALTLATSGARQRGLKSALDQAKEKFGHAMAALGGWRGSVESLRAMDLPSPERVAALQRARAEGLRAIAHAHEKLEALRADVNRLELEAKHFEGAHKVVTPTEVHEARLSRDGTWQSLRSGAVPLSSGAANLDAAIRLADELVDAQLGTATEAATLQSLRQQRDLARAAHEHHASLLIARRAEGEVPDTEWRALAERAGWADLPLDDASAWLQKRGEALAADTDVVLRHRELDAEIAAGERAQAALALALRESDVAVPDNADLPALCAVAQRHISAVDTAAARRSALTDQMRAAQRSFDTLKSASETVRVAY